LLKKYGSRNKQALVKLKEWHRLTEEKEGPCKIGKLQNTPQEIRHLFLIHQRRRTETKRQKKKIL